MSNSDNSDDDDDPNRVRQYEVGYKRPPKHTRFAKGKSGNLKGRPKKRHELFPETLQRVLDEVLTNRVTGTRLGAFEGIVRTARNKALAGNFQPLDQLRKLVERASFAITPAPEIDDPETATSYRHQIEASLARLQHRYERDHPSDQLEDSVKSNATWKRRSGESRAVAISPKRRRKKKLGPYEIFQNVFNETVSAKAGRPVTAIEALTLVAVSKALDGNLAPLTILDRCFKKAPFAVSDDIDTTDYRAEILSRLKTMSQRIRADGERAADDKMIALRRGISPENGT